MILQNTPDLEIFTPLFEKIESLMKEGNVILAIEGGSASGKTTLSNILKENYGCPVFHTDDFFLRPEQRTAERLNEIGGNFDRERFLEDVVVPLSENNTVCYRPFDCSVMALSDPVCVTPGKLTVIEGAYSMHPFLSEYYNLSLFIEIPEEMQKKRILKRNTPEKAQRFFSEWIPKEKAYFETFAIKEKCDLHINLSRPRNSCT